MDQVKAEALATLAKSLPDSVRANAESLVERMVTVIEGVGDKPIEWRPVFLRLVQGTTDRGSLPKGTAIGEYVLGERRISSDDFPFLFIPLRIWDARQMWSPDNEDNSILCSSPDAKVGYGTKAGHVGTACRSCPDSEWVDGQGSNCGKVIQMLGITSDLSEIFQFTFSKTSFTVGNDLKKMAAAAKAQLFCRVYGMASQTNTKYKVVENPTITVPADDAKVVPKEYLPFLKELFDQIGEGREEQLKAFYTLIEQKKNEAPQLGVSHSAGALSAPAATDDNTVVLGTEAEPESQAQVSDLAKNYHF